jgi:hypothetical protein
LSLVWSWQKKLRKKYYIHWLQAYLAALETAKTLPLAAPKKSKKHPDLTLKPISLEEAKTIMTKVVSEIDKIQCKVVKNIQQKGLAKTLRHLHNEDILNKVNVLFLANKGYKKFDSLFPTLLHFDDDE